MGWVGLEPWERRARLAGVHPRLTEDCLVAAGRTVAGLRPLIDAQRVKEDRLRVVLRYFGDEQQPNPGRGLHGPGINGRVAAHDCPPWERLPRLEDDAPQAEPAERRAAGRKHGPDPVPIPMTGYLEAVRLLDEGNMSLREISEATKITRQNIAKIRDSVNGRGYVVEPGPIPRTVVLRKPRKPR